MSSHQRNSGLVAWLRRRWYWLLGGVGLFLLGTYFVATSSPFVKAIILPKVGAMYGAKVTVGKISVSPFSRVVLYQAQIKTEGPESVLELEELHVKYSLWSILKGKIAIYELKAVSPKLQIITNPDGTSNLDSIIKAYLSMPAGGPKTFDINNLNLSQCRFHLVSKNVSGASDIIDVSGLNLTIDQFRNGGTGKITLGADLILDQKASPTNANSQVSHLKMHIDGSYSYDLTASLVPKKISGLLQADIQQAEGNWQAIPVMKAVLECDLTPTAIQNLALRFDRQGNSIGQIKVSGPMDLAQMEGRLVMEVTSLDRQVLNLVAIPMGYDCGTTSLSASNIVDFAQQGKIISAMGRFSGREMFLQKQQQKTQVTQADLDYHVQINRNLGSILLRSLEISCREGTQEWGRVQLETPMNFAWAGNALGFKDASLTFSVTNFNLAHWLPLSGDYASEGLLNITGKISSKKDGNELLPEIAIHGANLSVHWVTNKMKFEAFQANTKIKLENYHKATIQTYQLNLQEGGHSIFNMEGSGDYDLTSDKYQLRVNVKALLAALLKKQTVAGVKADSGEIKFNGLIVKNDKNYSLSSDVTLDGFTGSIKDILFQDYHTELGVVLQAQGSKLRFDRATWSSKRKFDSGGTFSFNGSFDLADQILQGDFNLVGLNPNAYNPFLSLIIAPLAIKSSSLNAKGQLMIDPKATSSIKAEMSLANTVISDPLLLIPAAPINLKANTTISIEKLLKMNISSLNVAFMDGASTQGTMGLAGTLDLADKKSQIHYRISGLNHRVLGPWLDPFLTPYKWIQGEMNADCSLVYEPARESSLQASGSLTNVLFQIPGDKRTIRPFYAQMIADSSFNTNGGALKSGSIAFTPTGLASNRIDLLGKFAIVPTNLYAGQFAIQGDALDFSPILNMFTNTASASTSSAKTATTAKQSAQTDSQAEPGAIQLPIKDFVGHLKLNRLYYGDLLFTNLNAVLKITNNTVQVEPFSFLLNGGSFAAKGAVDVSIPGYKYDLTLQADRIPVAPLANTFNTTQRDQYQGEINASANIKGAGTTGGNLKTNLQGHANFGITNASVNLISPRAKFLLTPIALLLRMPELLNSPVEALSINTRMGEGQVQIQPFALYSPALQARSEGTITWAPILTNSTLNLPVNVLLRRSLAEKSNLISKDTPTNALFVQLPDFLKMTGVLGAPKPEIDKMALAKMGLQSVGGIPLQVGGNAVDVLENFGGLLTGKKSSSVNTNKASDILLQSITNAPTQTNRSPVNTIKAIGNLFNRNKTAGTNAPGAKP